MGGCYSSLNISRRSKTCQQENRIKQTEATDYSAKDQRSDTSVTTGKESMPKKGANKKNNSKGKRKRTASPGKVEKKKKKDKHHRRTADAQITIDTSENTMKEKPEHSYRTSPGSTISSLHVPTANDRTSTSLTVIDSVASRSTNGRGRHPPNSIGASAPSSILRPRPPATATTTDSRRQLTSTNERHSKHYVGLRNAGATCYMNSIIQQLYHTPMIREVICTPGISRGRKDVLHQMCRVFQDLHSSTSFVNPQGFCSVFKLWGQRINTWEQQDAYEFFTDVTSQLDERLKANKQPEVFKAIFQGLLLDVYECYDLCNHSYEREDEFYGLTVSVSSPSLEASLKDFVEDVELANNNAYLCEVCAHKTTAVKRTCIKNLPQVLAIQLKRFKYNSYGRVVKYNNYFMFPWVIDMAPYTQEGLLNKEEEVNRKQKDHVPDYPLPGATCAAYDSDYGDGLEPQLYGLVGVVIHSGGVDGGHYYSLIRDREDIHFNEADKGNWYKCNDTSVTEFQMCDEVLERECFGGNYSYTAYGTTQRCSNAYILFYQKLDKENSAFRREELQSYRSNNVPLKLPPISRDTQVNPTTPCAVSATSVSSSRSVTGSSHQIRRNESFSNLIQKIQNETPEDYFKLRGIEKQERMRTIRRAAYSQDVTTDEKEQMLLYVLDTFFKTDAIKDRSETDLKEYCKTITSLLQSSKAASESAIKYLISHGSSCIFPLLLGCASPESRCIAAQTIHNTLKSYIEQRKSTKLVDTLYLDIIVEELLSLLDKEVWSHVTTCQEYIWVLFYYMHLDDICLHQMLCHNAFQRLMTFLIGTSQPKQKDLLPEETRRYLHIMLAIMIMFCDVSTLWDEGVVHVVKTELADMPSDMKKLLQSETEYVVYIGEAVLVYCECARGSKPIIGMLKHLSYCNSKLSVEIILQIKKQVAKVHVNNMKPALKLLDEMLTIDDPLQETRLRLVMEGEQGMISEIQHWSSSDYWRSYRCVRLLSYLFDKCQLINSYLRSERVRDWWLWAKSLLSMAPRTRPVSSRCLDYQVRRNTDRLKRLTLRDPAGDYVMASSNTSGYMLRNQSAGPFSIRETSL